MQQLLKIIISYSLQINNNLTKKSQFEPKLTLRKQKSNHCNIHYVKQNKLKLPQYRIIQKSQID